MSVTLALARGQSHPASPRRFGIVIVKDAHHRFAHFAEVLMRIFRFTDEEAYRTTIGLYQADDGRALVWTGSRDAVERKHEEVLHFIPRSGGDATTPIVARIEPCDDADRPVA
jgi:ATP-dependent Clp protease adapter protein ClpS